ncbi:MAG TPA: histidine kinase [Gemmatimonadaceae bacterium]|nr:histidine kinase [Gemmatimonadaceae bacterium]
MVSSPSSAPRPTRTALLSATGVLVVMVGLGLLVRASLSAPAGPRGALRRIPPPPTDLPSLLSALGVGSVTWYASIASVPVLWWLAYRLPVTQQRPWRAIGLQLAALLALVFLVSVAQYLAAYRGSPMAPSYANYLPVALQSSVVPLLGLAALLNALETRRRAVRGAIEAQRLRAELAESRLEAVTSQLQPHFLFNTLQSISTLIHKDPVAADAMLAKLSDLLRDVLRRSRNVLVSLDEELRMTGTYLELAQLRYGDRLRVTTEVDDSVRGAAVPMLLLQPLVENALRHGVGARAAGGSVAVSAKRDDGRLRIVVSDDGEGLNGDRSAREGTGLANTRERLRHAFGEDQSLELAARPGGGVDVTIRVPLQTVSTRQA